MDIKTEVRRRIADLTRFAYERGYRDGAQVALAEIETIATEDVAQHLEGVPAPLKAIAKTKRVDTKHSKPAAKTKTTKKKATKTRTAKPKAKGVKPKSIVVQEAMRALLADKGEARRDQVLEAAQADNPAITKFDLGNGIRTLVKRGDIKVAPDDPGRFLPA